MRDMRMEQVRDLHLAQVEVCSAHHIHEPQAWKADSAWSLIIAAHMRSSAQRTTGCSRASLSRSSSPPNIRPYQHDEPRRAWQRRGGTSRVDRPHSAS